jgi:hypothetical protein
MESFSGFEGGGEGMDTAAFEKFKERMKAAAAQLKALAAGEQKARKKEDELIKILLKFIKSGKKKDILLLVLRLLEQNVPAGFIVSLLVISNREMQEDLGLKMLPSGPEHDIPEDSDMETLPDRYLKESVLPLRVKIAIDAWLHEIAKRAADNPEKIIFTILDGEGIIKLPVTQLAVFSLRDFLEQQEVESSYDKLKDFMDMMLEGIIKKTREQFENRKQIRGY